MKKAAIFLFSAIFIFTSICIAPPANAAVSAGTYTNAPVMRKRLQTLLNLYTPGSSYFTSTYNGHNHLGDKTKPCNKRFVNGHLVEDFSTCGRFDGQIQCHAYAAYAQYILFGKTETGRTDAAVEGAASIRYTTVSNPTKAQLLRMPLGTHIRNTLSSSLSHSVILLKADENGIAYLDCNCLATWSCAVHLHTATWASFFSYNGIGSARISGYAAYPSADTYPKDSVYKNTPFIDIGTHWARDSIALAYERGMVVGKTADAFDPNSAITRAEFVQILYNIAGKPDAAGSAFADVNTAAWYAKAIGWAQQNQIIEGVGNGKFAPNAFITREQVCKILFHALSEEPVSGELDETEKQAALQEKAQTVLGAFLDKDKASGWALEYVLWAVEDGLLLGDDKGCLNPTLKATRAELVTLLLRVY